MASTNVEQIDTAGQLDVFIERVAAAEAAGSHSVIVKIPGAGSDVESVVERIQRMPQRNGWRNLTVLVGETTDQHAALTVTNDGTVGQAK